MRKRTALSCTFASAFLVLSLSSRTALAQTTKPTVNCKDPIARPNVIYAAGSTALRPFLGVMAGLLAKESPAYSVIYQSQGSCTGVSAIFDADPEKRKMKDIVGNWAVFYKTDGSTQECWLDVNGKGEPPSPPDPSWVYPPVDLGVSDVFASSCGATAPSGTTIADYFGPIQPMTFVVPGASTQTSISADAAYLAFGLGGHKGTAVPWVDPSLFFVRNAASGTQQMLARAIGVPADRWWGKNRGSSSAVIGGLKVVLDPATAEKSIGIVSTDLADADRSNLRILAFKARGQTCGYLPDSNANTRDKINVRDGHYPIWGPVHLFAQTSGGLPSTAAGAFVGRFATARVDKALLEAVISKSLMPQCAMKVTRTEELGAMASYSPPLSCSCFFDQTANGATSCKPCNAPADCAGTSNPACNFGFCEPR